MSELYGAPSGIIASEDNIRRNVASGMLAAKTLGEIEQQPAEKALKEAHARLYQAEATDKETNARAQQAMLDLQNNFIKKRAEDAARQQLVEGAKAAGKDATVADLPKGDLTGRSQAQSLEEFAKYAEERGVGPLQLAKVYKEAADIREKEAIGSYRQSQAKKQELDAQKERFTMVGNAAATAAQSPANYMAILSNPQMRQFLPPNLTGNFATDKPILEAISSASQDSLKRAELTEKMAEDANKAARRGAQNAASAAAVRVADARIGVLRERERILKKNSGEGDPSTVEARKALTAARQARAEAQFRKEFPPVPLDPKARVAGQAYVAADGKTLFTWEKDPASGQMVARKLAITKDQALAKHGAPAAAPAKAAEAEDTSGEADDAEED